MFKQVPECMQDVPEYSSMFQNVPKCIQHTDLWACMQFHELWCSYISFHAVTKAYMQLHKLALSYMSVHAVPWACMQFPELSWSSMSFYQVQWACMQFLFFVWAAHKNFAVLVFSYFFSHLCRNKKVVVSSSPATLTAYYDGSCSVRYLWFVRGPGRSVRSELSEC